MIDPRLLLQQIKLQDSMGLAYPMLHDSSLCIVVGAWMRASVKWEPPSMIEGDSPDKVSDIVDLVWEFSSHDNEELAFLAGMSEESTINVFSMAKSLTLVYPDGTVAKSAKNVLDAKMGAALGKLIKSSVSVKNRSPKDDKGDKDLN